MNFKFDLLFALIYHRSDLYQFTLIEIPLFYLFVIVLYYSAITYLKLIFSASLSIFYLPIYSQGIAWYFHVYLAFLFLVLIFLFSSTESLAKVLSQS